MVERYDCETERVGGSWNFYERGVMEPWPEGDWVKYEDYDQLQSRCEELETVNEQLLGEREGVRARRPDLTVQEIDELLRPEDALPNEHSEWRLASAKEKLSKARTALQKGGD